MVADLSHWVCVSETGPSDPDLTAVVEKLAGQMRHTHCRSESMVVSGVVAHKILLSAPVPFGTDFDWV